MTGKNGKATMQPPPSFAPKKDIKPESRRKMSALMIFLFKHFLNNALPATPTAQAWH
ncbi:hypothetical protein [Moraxella lacunata]|uniref:hypothetical protein n=1 Tax=Moraxella lacunata TaxID=477 RepID=UPI003EE3920A